MSTIAEESVAHVLFTLADTTYALPTAVIQQLDMVGTVTPVPNGRAYLAGIVSVRGQVLPAIDLRVRFGFPPGERTLRSRLLVARARGRLVGLIVDSAREFAHIPAAAVQPPPDLVGGGGRVVKGVAQLQERLVLVLDVEELLSDADAATRADPAPASA